MMSKNNTNGRNQFAMLTIDDLVSQDHLVRKIDAALDFEFIFMDATVIHRVGELFATDQIVFVGVSGAHRGEAFKACEFIIDYLKTEAPFWKKEKVGEGTRWVQAKETDEAAKSRWTK